MTRGFPARAAEVAVRWSARRRRRLPGYAARQAELDALGEALGGGRGRPCRAPRREPEGGPLPRRVLMVVQRYGPEMAGGAEALCRQLCSQMARRGCEVQVLTSCATDAVTWADDYPPGDSVDDGVSVHRLPVGRPRDPVAFEALARDMESAPEEWLKAQGPDLAGLVPWLEDNAGRFDVAMHFSYLYTTSWQALPVTAARVPTILHATAHDERAFWLPVYDRMWALPSAYAWLTPEERRLVRRRAGPVEGVVTAAGVDLSAVPAPARGDIGLGGKPYLLFVGRVEAGKGATELADYFVELKRRHPGELQLVFAGPVTGGRAEHPDIHYLGWVSDAQRSAALAGCAALVQPSYFESFSMVLVEAWAYGRPVLVQGRCDVLAGQARRSGGGLAYTGFAEFEAAVGALQRWPRLGGTLGAAGRSYVASQYSWDRVLGRYGALFHFANRRFGGF